MNLGYVLDNAFTRFANRVAFSDVSSQLSFRQLDETTRRLGTGLYRLGIPRQARVASIQGNSIELAELDVACARYGFARCLLGTKRSGPELLRALTLLQPFVVVFDQSTASQVAEIKESLPSPPLFLCVGSAPSWALSFERLIETSPAAPPIADLTGEDWHSIYLTSGTTGDPKMIVLTQANWLAVVRNHLIETYRHTEPTDVYLHAAPMTHASGSLVMAHLARGARQHVLHKFSPEAVLDSVDREGVTATWLSPTMLGMVLDYYQGRPCDFSKVKSLRYGAAPMMAHRLEQAVDQWGPIVCGAWGQWEAPQQCTFFSQQQIGDAAKGRDRVRLTSVGLPMLYSKVAAADEQGTILPPGTSGEIVVSGDHIMLGYLGDPEATGKLRFGEWQRTGDLGHVDHEGFVYITGRRRELIISGGVKVPPRQLEETIITHPEIADVAVVGIPDFKWGETIHAAVVLRAAGAVSEKELLEWFAAQFSKGLRPRSVQFFDALPRNEFGKVMRPELVNAYIKSRGAASDLHAQ